MTLLSWEPTRTPEPGEAGGSDSILVVEDDDAVRAYSTEVLRDLGYHVLEAPNAGAALEILDRQADVHLLFTDIGLPGAMNGRRLSDEATAFVRTEGAAARRGMPERPSFMPVGWSPASHYNQAI